MSLDTSHHRTEDLASAVVTSGGSVMTIATLGGIATASIEGRSVHIDGSWKAPGPYHRSGPTRRSERQEGLQPQPRSPRGSDRLPEDVAIHLRDEFPCCDAFGLHSQVKFSRKDLGHASSDFVGIQIDQVNGTADALQHQPRGQLPEVGSQAVTPLPDVQADAKLKRVIQ